MSKFELKRYLNSSVSFRFTVYDLCKLFFQNGTNLCLVFGLFLADGIIEFLRNGFHKSSELKVVEDSVLIGIDFVVVFVFSLVPCVKGAGSWVGGSGMVCVLR